MYGQVRTQWASMSTFTSAFASNFHIVSMVMLTLTQRMRVQNPFFVFAFFVAIASIIFSLHIRSMWETICDAQAGFWLNSKFLSKFSRKPLSGISDQKAPPPFRKSSDLRWPKFTPEYPPISEKFRFEMTKVYSGIPPHFGKVQVWDDQSLLQNTPPPPISENAGYRMWRLICNPQGYHSLKMQRHTQTWCVCVNRPWHRPV